MQTYDDGRRTPKRPTREHPKALAALALGAILTPGPTRAVLDVDRAMRRLGACSVDPRRRHARAVRAFAALLGDALAALYRATPYNEGDVAEAFERAAEAIRAAQREKGGFRRAALTLIPGGAQT